MDSYTFTPESQRQVDGLAAATARRNEDLFAAYTDLHAGEESPPAFVPITPAEYVQFVMASACESYANQYGVPQ